MNALLVLPGSQLENERKRMLREWRKDTLWDLLSVCSEIMLKLFFSSFEKWVYSLPNVPLVELKISPCVNNQLYSSISNLIEYLDWYLLLSLFSLGL